MTQETADLETRRSYLRSELAVWKARLARAETCEALRPLYWDHDLNAALGAMHAELVSLDSKLGSDTPRGTGGKRRINPNKGN